MKKRAKDIFEWRPPVDETSQTGCDSQAKSCCHMTNEELAELAKRTAKKLGLDYIEGEHPMAVLRRFMGTVGAKAKLA